MFRSATVRVTLVSVGITMAISLLFSAAIYHSASAEIRDSAHRQYVRLRDEYGFLAPPTAIYTQEQTEIAHNLILNLVYLNLIILGVAGLVGYYWARQTLEPIEQAMELQGRFAADASHELRTPLAAMRSEIEVALRSKQISEKEARELLASNLEEIAKLESLAGGLLQLARLESAFSHLEPVSAQSIIASSIKSFAAQIKSRHIAISQSGSDFKVMGQSDSLAQVITILLDNAIKYGKPSGKIEVVTRSSGHRGTIIVKDDGPGISAEDLPHVFERFWQASTSRSKTQVEGFGLGLAIAREIVALHKGEIRASSQPGQGAQFTIELPLA